MNEFPGSDIDNRLEKRKARAQYIHQLVETAYKAFPVPY